MAELLLERERLEQTITDNFTREVSILFSDICGFTQFTENKGDLQSRAMLIRHNQIVLPVIEQHHGNVIEVIGDGVMAVFDMPLKAVEAAVDIHQKLSKANEEAPPDNQIHVKIGINMGRTLLDEGADFQSYTGDTANVAARIQSHAGKDDILISRSVYERVEKEIKWFCHFHDSLSVKGKSKSLPVYRVLWKSDETPFDNSKRTGADSCQSPLPEVKEQIDSPVVTLEIGLDGSNLNISMNEKRQGEESTLRYYESVPFIANNIEERCKTLVEILNKANRRGQISGQIFNRLREIGQLLYDELLSLKVKERLHQTNAKTLILSIDDKLVHIPWELLFDGMQFFCMRFCMGRIVRTRQIPSNLNANRISAPLNMLILADPTGDLKNAYKEGTQIRDFLDQDPALINVSLRTDHITADTLKAKLRSFELIHFAGHADYNVDHAESSGWRLRNGILTTADIKQMAGSAAMPTMVFSNACQSARTEQWALDDTFEEKIFGLANAFLLSGVKHYIGTFWEILDEPGSRFAVEFYKHLFSGGSVGEAVLNARHALLDFYGEETIIWASYVFYGDPTFNYMAQIKTSPTRKRRKTDAERKPPISDRTREEIIDFSQSRKPSVLPRWLWTALAVLLLATLALWGYSRLQERTLDALETEAKAFYMSGEYEKAYQVCLKIQNRTPGNLASAVLLAGINLSQGKLDEARRFFNLVLEKNPESRSIKAEAFLGLGRLASIDSRPDEAMGYYQQAADLEPGNVRAVSSQAILLEQQGRFEDAFRVYSLASSLSPNDAGLRAAADQIKERLAFMEDDARQERTDRLIEEILAADNIEPTPSTNTWTSKPVTVWLLDFETSGFSIQEGEERLIHSLIIEKMVSNKRLQVVERGFLDKLLAELKIGSSKLVSRETALTVGRLAAARILLFSHVYFTPVQSKVTVRMVESETGLILSSFIVNFNSSEGTNDVAEKLFSRIVSAVRQHYPVQATITAVRGGMAVIDVGQQVGVYPGMLLKGQDADITIRVSSVDRMESEAEIISGQPEIRPGIKIEESPVPNENV